MDEPAIRELKPGETVRMTVLAGRWLDVTNTGWVLKISGPKGVQSDQVEPGVLTVSTREPIGDDEL